MWLKHENRLIWIKNRSITLNRSAIIFRESDVKGHVESVTFRSEKEAKKVCNKLCKEIGSENIIDACPPSPNRDFKTAPI